MSPPESSPDPIMQPVLSFWNQYLQQVLANTPGSELTNDQARQWRDRWLDAARQSMDAYMRTPPFLEAIKGNIDLLIRLKQHADQLNQQLVSAAGGNTSEQHMALLDRLQQLEQTILDRLDVIERRLDQLETTPQHGAARKRTRKTAKKGK